MLLKRKNKYNKLKTMATMGQVAIIGADKDEDDDDYQMIQRMTSKQLRQKALEFLSSKKYANNLVDIISQWDVSFYKKQINK